MSPSAPQPPPVFDPPPANRKPVSGPKGEPFFMLRVAPAAPSPPHSYIDGVSVNVMGSWEKLADAAGPGSESVATDGGGTVLVGETIRIIPTILDHLGNPALAKDDNLTVAIKTQAAGLELLRAQPQTTQGQVGYDLRYEVKRKGAHELHVMLDDLHIKGSPVEWDARVRAPKEAKEAALGTDQETDTIKQAAAA